MNQYEKDLVDKLQKYLERYGMKIEREVWSDCMSSRIDIYAVCDKGFIYGIECKNNDSKKGAEIGAWIKQAIKYSFLSFRGKKIPIFVAPQISIDYFCLNDGIVKWEKTLPPLFCIKDRHAPNHTHHSFNGFLSSFDIGELRKSYTDNSYIYFSRGNKTIWTPQEGTIAKWYNYGLNNDI